jgi:hypothetical protein
LQRREPIDRWVYILKADIEYSAEHGEVINCTLDGVSIQPVTTKIQLSFLTQLPERKEMRPIVTLKQLQSLIAVIGENIGLINIVVNPQY